MGHRFDELPVVTTPSDSDKIVVEHDSLTSQITLARLIAAERNRLNQLESALQSIGSGSLYYAFSNTEDLTTQMDNLPQGTYIGKLSSYGHQSETGVPENDSYYVYAQKTSTINEYIRLTSVGQNGTTFYKIRSVDGWASTWTKEPSRAEITNIGKRTEVVGDMVSTTTTFAYTGKSVTITKTSYVEAMLSFTNTSTDTIAILGAASGNSTRFYAQQKNNDPGGITPSYICCGTVLPAGTYYIWAKSRSNGSNAIYVYVTQIEP